MKNPFKPKPKPTQPPPAVARALGNTMAGTGPGRSIKDERLRFALDSFITNATNMSRSAGLDGGAGALLEKDRKTIHSGMQNQPDAQMQAAYATFRAHYPQPPLTPQNVGACLPYAEALARAARTAWGRRA